MELITEKLQIAAEKLQAELIELTKSKEQLRQEYQEILDIKDRQLQIKEETIGACRQEIDYLRGMVDELLKQPTLAELVGIADQIKANLK